MKNSEQNLPEKFPLRAGDAKYIYSEKLDEIALTASDMEVFQNAVRQAKNKLEALRAVRELLPEHFSEIAEIPEAKIEKPGVFWPAPNEFKIAKSIVELLWLGAQE
jgi:hypothetical protein